MRSMAAASSGVAARTIMAANPRLAHHMLGDWATLFLALLVVVVLSGGVLITAAEPASFPNVARGYAWTVATLVTAGHTTPEPTTTAGRAISSTIIVMGLGAAAALAASIMGRRA